MKQQQLLTLHQMGRGGGGGGDVVGSAAEQKAIRQMERKASVKKGSFATRCVQGDAGVSEETDHAPAIHVATTYAMHQDEKSRYIYARANAPTRDRLETAWALVEGGAGGSSCHALSYSCGMAAISSVFQGLAMLLGVAGNHEKIPVLTANTGYTGTKSYFESPIFAAAFSKTDSVEDFAKSAGKKVIFCELLRNPDSQLVDLDSLVTLARDTQAMVVVDATFATPVLCRPLELGCHVVLHSASKFIGGHSDVLAGLVATSDMGLFLKLHAIKMWQGSIPGNLETFLLLRSLRTLPLRVKESSRSAFVVAKFLRKHIAVESVSNGILDQKQLWKKLRALNEDHIAAPCFTFILKQESMVKPFMDRLRLFEVCTSLGGAASSIDHRSRWDSSRNVCEFRISIGLEDPEDLMADLDNALRPTE